MAQNFGNLLCQTHCPWITNPRQQTTHRALSEVHSPHLPRKSDKGKPRAALPFPTITRKSWLGCTGGTRSSHSMNRAHYRDVQTQTPPWKGFTPPLPDPSKVVHEAQLRSESRENTHLSVEAIQSETEISTSYQFSLDPQLLTLLSRPCSVSRAQLCITCAQLQTSFSAHIENQLHFHSTLKMQMNYAFCAERNHYSSADLLKHWYGSKSLRSSLFSIIFKIRQLNHKKKSMMFKQQ